MFTLTFQAMQNYDTSMDISDDLRPLFLMWGPLFIRQIIPKMKIIMVVFCLRELKEVRKPFHNIQNTYINYIDIITMKHAWSTSLNLLYLTETRIKKSKYKSTLAEPSLTTTYDNLRSSSGPIQNLATRSGSKEEYKISYLAPHDRSNPLEINVVPASPSATHRRLNNIEGKEFIIWAKWENTIRNFFVTLNNPLYSNLWMYRYLWILWIF